MNTDNDGQQQADDERRRQEEEALALKKSCAIANYAERMIRYDLGHAGSPAGNTYEEHGPLLMGRDGKFYRETRLK